MRRAKRRRCTPADQRLNTLKGEWDAMFDAMQAPGAHEAMQRAFNYTPEELGAAAVKVAKSRRRDDQTDSLTL